MTILRPFRDDDAPLVAQYCADRDLAIMTARIPHPYSLEIAEKVCAFSQGPESRNWVVTEDGGDLIGMIGSSVDGDTANIGYWIGQPFTKHGHATRAAAILIERIFAEPQIRILTAHVYQDNPASARVLKNNGFIQGPDIETKSIARGPGTYPTWTFVLTRTHWATPVLKTERLTLRPYRDTDSERLLTLINDLQIARMLAPVPHPYTPELAAEWISGAIWNADDIHFVLDDGSGLIGACGLGPSRGDAPMIGFWLGRRYWGHGLMSEAVFAMLDWIFNVCDEEKLISYAFVDNFASQRIHEKAGFVAGATEEHYSTGRGAPIDAIRYTLQRDDWQAKQ